jgi:hypothetical protein
LRLKAIAPRMVQKTLRELIKCLLANKFRHNLSTICVLEPKSYFLIWRSRDRSASLTTPVVPLVWYLYRVKMDVHSRESTFLIALTIHLLNTEFSRWNSRLMTVKIFVTMFRSIIYLMSTKLQNPPKLTVTNHIASNSGDCV